ncbi:MAG: hypothetical protein A2289_13140 [Deltaproteobacteria bacterium RIFOXYA12_FULL_58_15]|nr:MAG: hypothetical protein A2289_13140 [Deltaproteobacteria bacterium RIFOXYA12_FULL_58_15]OGR09448.1 MAG: hypothetical protein A2341_18130 [Deltaproteobacteria bacterium RIFOXYB12_FULL_58_9]
MTVSLLCELTKRELLERYAGSMLGGVWSFLRPALTMLVFVVVFSNIMGVTIPGYSSAYSYSVYLIAGLLPWTAFSTSIIRATTVLVARRDLLTTLPLPLLTLPAVVVLAESVALLPAILLFLAFLAVTGMAPTYSVWTLPVVFVLHQLFALGVGFLLAVLHVFLRDLKELTDVTVQMWFWLTPIAYVATILPQEVAQVVAFNPAYWFVRAYQDLFVFRIAPSTIDLALLAAVAGLTLGGACVVAKVLESDVRDLV